jgi:hypothetical protein
MRASIILAATALCFVEARAQRVVVVDDAVKVSPEGAMFSHAKLHGYFNANPAWDGNTVTLAGAAGERVAFQILVKADAGELAAVNVSVSDLARGSFTIPASAFQLFREWYVQVTRPSTSPHGNAGLGWYPDALIPAAVPEWGLPVKVAAGKRQGIWVDLKIPRAAGAGAYKGTVTVAAGGKTLAALPLALTVYPFALPAERHLRWRIGYSDFELVLGHYKIPPGSEEALRIEEELYRLCWEDCRFVPTTHYNSPRPTVTGKGADLKIDWTTYDRRFGHYLDGSAFEDHQPVNIFSLPVNTMRGWPVNYKTPLARMDVAALAAAVRQTVAHWDEKQWRLQDGFVYVADEPGLDLYPNIKKVCETIRQNSDKRIATSVAFYTDFAEKGPELVREFGDHVTMWDIAGDCMGAYQELRARQAKGDTIGFYQGSEPFQGSEALDGDGLSLTTWPWIAWRYHLDTLFLYNMCEWDYFRLNTPSGRKKPWANGRREIWENPLNQSWQSNSQGVLLYPGSYVNVRGVLPSIRMKQIRRGMQDYEYFWLLAQRGDKAKADAINRRIVPKALHEAAQNENGKLKFAYGAGQWERDPRQWAAARTEMAGLLSAGQ